MPQSKMQQDRPGDPLTLLVGQLLATTEAAKLGIQSLSAESRENGRAIVAAAATLEIVEKNVHELTKLVRDGNGKPSLVNQVTSMSATMDEHGKTIHIARNAATKTDLEELTSRVAQLEIQGHQSSGARQTIFQVVNTLGWLITIVIALYAAWNKL